MSKGALLIACNNNQVDYIKQAIFCAERIKNYLEIPVTLVTSNSGYFYENYKDKVSVFDTIIDIDNSSIDNYKIFRDGVHTEYRLKWKNTSRDKVYELSPYNETIVMDTDMLVLQNIDSWWNFLSNYEVFYTSKVYTYRGEVVNDTYYRKTYIANNLPNVYAGFHYFKKCDFAKDFYSWLELVMNNWQFFYGHYASKEYQNFLSVDTSTAIVTKILDCEDQITNKKVTFPSFTHMHRGLPIESGDRYLLVFWLTCKEQKDEI